MKDPVRSAYLALWGPDDGGTSERGSVSLRMVLFAVFAAAFLLTAVTVGAIAGQSNGAHSSSSSRDRFAANRTDDQEHGQSVTPSEDQNGQGGGDSSGGAGGQGQQGNEQSNSGGAQKQAQAARASGARSSGRVATARPARAASGQPGFTG